MGKKKYGKIREIRQISEIEPEIIFDENDENSTSIKQIKIKLAMWEFGQNDPKRYIYIYFKEFIIQHVYYIAIVVVKCKD
jgi:hypothetical protein